MTERKQTETNQPPPYRWDDIQLLLDVARTGSFCKAAQKFRIHQSTVSRRIAALEEHVGGAIFDREPAFTGYPPRELTELGGRLFIRALTVAASVRAFEAEAKQAPNNTVEQWAWVESLLARVRAA